MADDVLAELFQRPGRTQRVVLAWNPDEAEDLKAAKAVARQALRVVNGKTPPDTAQVDLAEAERRVAEIEEGMERIVFEFSSIGTKKVDDLIGEHPPTSEQMKDHKAAGNKTPLTYNVDTFMRALVAETCTKITTPSGNTLDSIDLEQINALFATTTFSQADQVALFNAASLVDVAASSIDDIRKG